jgi:hypothetical protein
LSQYVVGGTVKKIVTYKITSINNVPATINRLVFNVSNADSIQSIQIGSTTASVAGGVADVNGLALAVPGTPAGVTIPVTVTYSCFLGGNVGAGCNLTNSPVTPRDAVITLATVEAMSGGTTAPLTPVGTQSSNIMKLVASKPTVAVAASVKGLAAGSMVVHKFTVTADAGGDIQLTKLPWIISGTNATVGVPTDVRANGGSIASLGAITATDFTFTNPYNVTAGQSVTFEVIAPVSGVASNASVISYTSPKAEFLWNDVIGGGLGGNVAPGLNGTLILPSFDTNSYSISN